jgi:hypothetical protein
VARFRKDITLAEVKQHNTVDDAWIVLRGKVIAFLAGHAWQAGCLLPLPHAAVSS